MHQLTGNEKMFYEDQQTSQECSLSGEIDIEHTNEMEQIQSHANEARLTEEAETSYALYTDNQEQFNQPDDNSFVDKSLNTGVNHSGLPCMTIPKCDASLQIEDIIIQSNIRLHNQSSQLVPKYIQHVACQQK